MEGDNFCTKIQLTFVIELDIEANFLPKPKKVKLLFLRKTKKMLRVGFLVLEVVELCTSKSETLGSNPLSLYLFSSHLKAYRSLNGDIILSFK